LIYIIAVLYVLGACMASRTYTPDIKRILLAQKVLTNKNQKVPRLYTGIASAIWPLKELKTIFLALKEKITNGRG
jgi:hypothetical protein